MWGVAIFRRRQLDTFQVGAWSGWREDQLGWKVVSEEIGGRCDWRGRQGPAYIGLMGQVGSLDFILIAWEAFLGMKQRSDSI